MLEMGLLLENRSGVGVGGGTGKRGREIVTSWKKSKSRSTQQIHSGDKRGEALQPYGNNDDDL